MRKIFIVFFINFYLVSNFISQSPTSSEDAFIEYIDNNRIDDIEGIYRNIKIYPEDNNYKIGIKKYSNNYKGVILESSTSLWKVGETKFILEPTAIKSIFSCKVFMADKTTIQCFASMPNVAMLEIDFPAGNNYEAFKIAHVKLYPTNLVSSKNDSDKGSNNQINQNNISWKGNGSGLIISTDGYLVTNYHVVDEMSDFEVEFKFNQEITSFKAKLIKSDVTNDLAILKIDDEEFTDFNSIPYNFKSRNVDVGTEVYALGYPMALTIMGRDIKFTDGRISSKTGYKGDITTYQTTTPIQPGNSGGPLFDHNANLIGINSSGLNKEIADNVSYTIKTNYLINLIDVLPKPIPIPSSTWIASKPLTEQIKILSNYVVLIKVK